MYKIIEEKLNEIWQQGEVAYISKIKNAMDLEYVEYRGVHSKAIAKYLREEGYVLQRRSSGVYVLPKKDSNLGIYKFTEKQEWIYLLSDGVQYHKIGRTSNIKERISHWLRNPSFSLVGYYPVENSKKVEKELHSRYSQYKVQGEWFDLPTECIEEIKEGRKPC